MKKYSFVLKPMFFIFNLLFASWLVIKIENIQPSDVSKKKSLFVKEDIKVENSNFAKTHFENIYSDYKTGIVDSATFDRELRNFLEVESHSRTGSK